MRFIASRSLSLSIKNIEMKGYTDQELFFLIAGPCVVEDEYTVMKIAEHVKTVTSKYGIPYVFKASYKKANRSSIHSFTGIGDEKALKIIGKVREELQLLTTTDFHTEGEALMAAEYVDILQVPAFLCRQTSLLEAAANTGKVVNVKKGQFLSADAMSHVVTKLREFEADDIMLTERGTTFGYQDLVVDYRGIPTMQKMNVPVIMDCTHSLQRPNQSSGVTGGDPTMISTIAKAAVAVGVDGLFIETHQDCANAKSDGANMLPLDELDDLLAQLVTIRQATFK